MQKKKQINRGVLFLIGIVLLTAIAVFAESMYTTSQDNKVYEILETIMQYRVDYCKFPDDMRNNDVTDDELSDYLEDYYDTVKDMFCENFYIADTSALDREKGNMAEFANLFLKDNLTIKSINYVPYIIKKKVKFSNNYSEAKLSAYYCFTYTEADDDPIHQGIIGVQIKLLRENGELKIVSFDITDFGKDVVFN